MSNTQFTDDQIVLQSLIDSGLVPMWRLNFATSIAAERNLSVKQAFWVKKIIEEICQAPTTPVAATSNYDAVFNMFTTASKHLKYPKVRLESSIGQVQLSVASKNAKYPGSISIVIASQCRGFVGRIRQGGMVDINRNGEDIKAKILDFLTEFNKDPVKMAVEYGKLHSHCCFCALPLKTKESLAVGYGDTCAKHYGLPWGKQKITDPEILEYTPVAQAAFDLTKENRHGDESDR
jgi:Family of unknown function (DUF6011)